MKVQLVNVFAGVATSSLVAVFTGVDPWFVIVFQPFVVVAFLAFVALVPSVGRRQMVYLAKQNGLEKEEQVPPTANARFEARREMWRRQGELSSDDWSGR